MKNDIHPQINTDVTVKCACGNTFVTQSVLDSITVDICSACHPLYTGKHKLVDTEGRIDKYQRKMERAKAKQEKYQASKTQKDTTKKAPAQKTLKEALADAKKA